MVENWFAVTVQHVFN